MHPFSGFMRLDRGCMLLRRVIVRSSAPIHVSDGFKVCLLCFYGQQVYLRNRRAFGWTLSRCCMAGEEQECCQSVEGGWKKKAKKIWTVGKFDKTCNYEDANATALMAFVTSTSAQRHQSPHLLPMKHVWATTALDLSSLFFASFISLPPPLGFCPL